MTEEDHQHKSPANLSHFRYIRIGAVNSYNISTKFAKISLNNGFLSKNDDIIIMGTKNDTYVHQRADIIKFNGKKVDKTPRGTKKEIIIIELKINEPILGNSMEKVYIFTDKTYKSQKYTF
jgi:hypothetical protein